MRFRGILLLAVAAFAVLWIYGSVVQKGDVTQGTYGLSCIKQRAVSDSVTAHINGCTERLNVIILSGILGKWDGERKSISSGQVIEMTGGFLSPEYIFMACVAPLKPYIRSDNSRQYTCKE